MRQEIRVTLRPLCTIFVKQHSSYDKFVVSLFLHSCYGVQLAVARYCLSSIQHGRDLWWPVL